MDYGLVEPIHLSGSMVQDFKVTGPELVSYEGPVAALELLPDPDSASPWVNTDLKVIDNASRPLGTHFGRSRLLARGSKGITMEVQMGELLRMLQVAGQRGRERPSGLYYRGLQQPTRSVRWWPSATSSHNSAADRQSTSA